RARTRRPPFPTRRSSDLYTIERQQNLYNRTIKVLPYMGYKPHFFLGDGSKGVPEHAPYDKILVTAGAPFVPDVMLKQLRVGGVRSEEHTSELQSRAKLVC